MNARIKQLINKMQKAPDFGYDDEATELTSILDKQGLRWKWEETFVNPKVIILPQQGYNNGHYYDKDGNCINCEHSFTLATAS